MRNQKAPVRLPRKAMAVLLAATIDSQVFADTGGLRIVVTDDAGKPVAGAMVQASTPESLTSRSALTDANGELRLLRLDPSAQYELVVSGVGYQPLRNNNVQVVSGRTFTLAYVIERSDSIEEVLVLGRPGRTQLVDTTSALVSTDVTLDLTDALPTGRSYQSYLQLAASTKPTLDGNPSSKSGLNYSDAVDSSGNTAGTSTDNVYYIDGVNITDNLTGGFGANFNAEIIQEQQIITGGVPAQYEGGQGLISRVVTKSGSNEFHASLSYYAQNDSLVADNDKLPASSFASYDTAFTLGGPIINDKLWFFASYQRQVRDEDIIDPATETLQRSVNTTQDLGFIKLTWAASERDKFIAEFFQDPYERDGSDDYTVLANRDSARIQGGDNYKYSYSHSWDNWIVTLDYASHEGQVSSTAADSSSRNDVAYNGIVVTKAQTDRGGRGANIVDFRNKDTQSITVEYFLDTAFGYHEIKGGYTQTKNERLYDLQYTGDGAQYTSIGTENSGTRLQDYTRGTWTGRRDLFEGDYRRIIAGMAASGNSAYFHALLDKDSSGSISSAELALLRFNTSAGNPDSQVNVYRIKQTQKAPLTFRTEGDAYFLQDAWNITAHWTLNAGVRAEKWEHIATDGTRVFTFDWDVAPRLSVVYDIFGDGGSKVWAFRGRYYDPIRTDMTQFAGTLSGSVREEQVFVGDQWVGFRTRGGARVQDAYFAPSTKTPYTDEKMIGFEHSLASDMSMQITYTDRVTKDILEDYDLGFYTDPFAAGAYALPLSYFGFETLPSANYFIATLAGGVRDYEGVELTLRKRRSAGNRWQMLASYAYNAASGNSSSDGNADLQGDLLYLDPRAPNVYGRQPGNIAHLLKLAGSYRFDNGIELGLVYRWNSGLVYSETFSQYGRHTPLRVVEAYESLGASTRWVASGSVGSHTTDSYGTLDLRAKYTMNFGSFDTELFLDVFNVLDDQAVTREQELVGGDGVYAFGEGNAWASPRRFYLGVRMQF